MSLPQNGWLPQNLQITTSGGLVPVPNTTYQQFTGSVKIDFDDVVGATSYTLMFCPVRLTHDLSTEGIMNHFPSCGTLYTYNVPVSVISLNYSQLVPGDKYTAFITAFDNAGGYSYSKSFEFTAPAQAMYDQTVGNMEYCVNAAPAPAPVQVAVIKKGKH